MKTNIINGYFPIEMFMKSLLCIIKPEAFDHRSLKMVMSVRHLSQGIKMSQSSIYINQAHLRLNITKIYTKLFYLNEFEVKEKKHETKNSNVFRRFKGKQSSKIQRKINEHIKTGCFIFDFSSGKHRIEYQSISVCVCMRSLTGSSLQTRNYISISKVYSATKRRRRKMPDEQRRIT